MHCIWVCFKDRRILEETGDIFGYSSILTLFPDDKLGIFVAMSGEDDDDLFRITASSYVADVMNGQEPWLNASSLCTFPEPFMKQTPNKGKRAIKEVSLGRPANDFAGIYRNNLYGDIAIAENNGSLQLQYGYVVFDLIRRDSKSYRFYMISTGIAEHAFKRRSLEFKASDPEKPNYINIASLPHFEDNDFIRQPHLTVGMFVSTSVHSATARTISTRPWTLVIIVV